MGRGSRWSWGNALAVALCIFGISGCTGAGAFVCVGDEDCNAQPGGQCEASGYCSFPDAACITGQRYGDAAGEGLSQRCVPAEEGSTSEATTTTTTASTSPTGVSTLGSTMTDDSTSSAGSSTSGTTQGVTISTSGSSSSSDSSDSSSGASDSSPTGADSSSSTDTTGSSSSTDTTGQAGCEFAVSDSFDGASFGPEWAPDSAEVSIGGGNLIIHVPASNTDFDFLRPTQTLSGENISIVASLADAPDQEFSQALVAFTDIPSDSSIDFVIGPDAVSAREWTGTKFISHAQIPFVPTEHVFFRLRSEGAAVFYEVSADGTAYTTLYEADLDVSGWQGDARIGGGSWSGNPMEEDVRFGAVEICASL